jgi:hypothetical protein
MQLFRSPFPRTLMTSDTSSDGYWIPDPSLMTTDMVIDNYLFCVIVVGEMHYKLMRILITSCCSTVAIQVSSTMRILHCIFNEWKLVNNEMFVQKNAIRRRLKWMVYLHFVVHYRLRIHGEAHISFLFCVGVKIGLTSWGMNVDCGCLQTGWWKYFEPRVNIW